MLTLKDLENTCKALSASMDDEFSIPISINARLTSILGRCCYCGNDYNGYQPYIIEISKKYLEIAPDEEVLQTIKHEWCHYYLTKLTRIKHGHDKAFKALCNHIGIAEDRLHSFNPNVKDALCKADKYTVYCPHCNCAIAGFSRMCKTLRQIDFCTCKRCGGSNLYYKQNW